MLSDLVYLVFEICVQGSIQTSEKNVKKIQRLRDVFVERGPSLIPYVDRLPMLSENQTVPVTIRVVNLATGEAIPEEHAVVASGLFTVDTGADVTTGPFARSHRGYHLIFV